MRSFILGFGVVLVGVAVGGCGGGPAGARPPVDGAAETGPDAAMEAGRPPGVTCPAVSAGEKRGLGACCAAGTDCADGICWNGFCTRACTGSAGCGAVMAPSPLPVGTVMSCATNAIGNAFQYCLPGSLQDCTTASAGCPSGEACALGLDRTATSATAATAYAGLCLTKLTANAYLPVGSVCQPEDGPYACETQGGYLGSGCFAHRCTRACGRSNDCPIGTQCQPAPYAAALGGSVSFLAPAGAGICMGRFCGQVPGQVGAPVGQVSQQGADSLCVADEVCVPTMAVGAAGEIQYLSCVPPRPGALPFGAACSRDPAQGLRCADDALCVTRDSMRFCSSLCRVDADCPADSFCVDGYTGPPLPRGGAALLSMCTPRALLPGVPCHSEKTCAANQACLPLSARSNQFICRPAVGTKAVGEGCAANSECRSGECFDRDLHTATGSNRTACAAPCVKNSDCGNDQICLRVVRDSNGTTDDPRDDVVSGLCTTLHAPALAGACLTNDNCTGQTSVDETGGDTCDVAHRTCFTQGAHIGDGCTHRADCPLGAYCRLNDLRFPGGICLSQGCDPLAPATDARDGCPAGAICVERGTDTPIRSCYPGCTGGTVCARAAEGYRCEVVGASATDAVCISQGGP